MREPHTPSVVIIGAGFSGAITAAHLLRGATGPLRVVLLNRSGRMARGVAYGTRSESHVLNVPAGRMSAFADDEEQFLRFARSRDASVTGGSFVPRPLYGEYLEHVLTSAEELAAPGVVLDQVVGEAAAVEGSGADPRMTVTLTDGRRAEGEYVVLALGNYAPANPPVQDTSFYQSLRYIRDPWAPGARKVLKPDEPVLVIGTGLTMLDVVLDLRRHGQRAPIHAVSRRGLIPQPHRSPSVAPSHDHKPPDIETGPATALAYFKSVRRHIKLLAKQGVDWREVIGSLRGCTPALWSRLSVRERAQFVRHLRVYWDLHRHRAAPEPWGVVSEMLRTGAMRVHPGRIRAFAEDERGVGVIIQPRGEGGLKTIRVARVVNCTGPDNDTRTLRDPLIEALRARGMVRPDKLGLGLETSDGFALLDATGRPSERMLLVGPLLKEKFWESTAVPELRLHAAGVAKALIGKLGGKPRG